mmetsp:Transcript_74270/g.194792  ORF Transcript_74270/g.194792 Transcript_74270/m.194792 type:complete len:302 (-) Transcript_74270:82-987(-)
MAKSIRSKIKKRLRTAKRQRVDAMIIVPRLLETNAALTKVMQGRAIKLGKPKNGFKYPEADDAFFPQHEVIKPIDFRAQAMPMVGYAFRGNRRKYDEEQQKMMDDLAKNSHPEMETMAGGGAVHAKTGKKVTRKEAELLATSIQKPEMSALAQQEAEEAAARAAAKALFIEGKRQGSSAKAADGDMEMEDAPVPEPTPEGAADHSRRPVVKDQLKQKRKTEGRARPNSASTNKAGKRMTNEDVQAALQSAMPKKPPAAAAAASAPPAAVAADATPAPAASAAASPKKKKGRKSGGGAAMDE